MLDKPVIFVKIKICYFEECADLISKRISKTSVYHTQLKQSKLDERVLYISNLFNFVSYPQLWSLFPNCKRIIIERPTPESQSSTSYVFQQIPYLSGPISILLSFIRSATIIHHTKLDAVRNLRQCRKTISLTNRYGVNIKISHNPQRILENIKTKAIGMRELCSTCRIDN